MSFRSQSPFTHNSVTDSPSEVGLLPPTILSPIVLTEWVCCHPQFCHQLSLRSLLLHSFLHRSWQLQEKLDSTQIKFTRRLFNSCSCVTGIKLPLSWLLVNCLFFTCIQDQVSPAHAYRIKFPQHMDLIQQFMWIQEWISKYMTFVQLFFFNPIGPGCSGWQQFPDSTATTFTTAPWQLMVLKPLHKIS